MYVGNTIKVRFFGMKNIDGAMYAKIKVMSPKKVKYNEQIVDLERLNKFSEEGNGIYVGVEQGEENKDSLHCTRGKERKWTSGHTGYFSIVNVLLSEQDDEIRKVLGVDNDWDGEWSEEDIIREGTI